MMLLIFMISFHT